MIYNILDNGGNPYIVEILKNKNVKIFENEVDISEDEKEGDVFENDIFGGPKNLETKLIMEFKPLEIFIGKSPKTKRTESSEAYGKDFDGNTILFDMGNNEYIFINRNIESFKSKDKIIDFVSPVGNSGVPYPYAIDVKGNFYLLIEDVVLNVMKHKELLNIEDPYEYYYNIFHISEFYIGDKKYNMKYSPNSKKEYDNLIRRFNQKIYIIDNDNSLFNKVECDKECYCSIMKNFAKKKFIKDIKKKLLFTNF